MSGRPIMDALCELVCAFKESGFEPPVAIAVTNKLELMHAIEDALGKSVIYPAGEYYTGERDAKIIGIRIDQAPQIPPGGEFSRTMRENLSRNGAPQEP